VFGVLRLDPGTFAEVAGDGQATWQALAVAAVAGVSISLQAVVEDGRLLHVADRLILVGAVALVALIATGVAMGVLVLYSGLLGAVAALGVAGERPPRAFPRLLRAVGFASAPSAFRFLSLAPTVGWLLGTAVALWTFAATVVAVRQALDTTTGRALGLLLGTNLALLALLFLAVLARGS
jgi:hypothetical protein